MIIASQVTAFSIGICASDASENLGLLLALIESEKFPEEFALRRIIIVASGCSESTVRIADSFAQRDDRVVLIKEPQRYGKADAINKIMKNLGREYMVFVNADALPEKGAIGKLLSMIQRSSTTGLVSGSPFFEQKRSLTSAVEQLMWEIHNECSSRLNHMGLSNHGSDEMMVVRSQIISELPVGIVNDGAYIGGMARLNGFSIKFCNEARVLIDVPSKIVDVIRQRRRIIVGHFQVWRLTGKSPKTVESLLLFSPIISLGIVVRILARYPRLITIFPLAVISETMAIAFALKDMISKSSEKHSVWKRYGN
ncbi:MAG: glycosyltransferase [Nitrososphaerales archaeon]